MFNFVVSRPLPSEYAAHVRGLRGFGDVYGVLMQPQWRSSVACTSVHDWYRLQSVPPPIFILRIAAQAHGLIGAGKICIQPG